MPDADPDTPLDLSGQILIAMPGMGDPRFDRTVIYMCAHSEDGAMGLIINKPAEDLEFSELLERLDINAAPGMAAPAIHIGGPVEHARGFVLHSADYQAEGATLRVDERIAMTATLDVLEDIARGAGPNSALLALGYSGWGPGQLEGEIARNGWLTGAASAELIFSADDGGKWSAALQELGIDPLLLSAAAGRA